MLFVASGLKNTFHLIIYQTLHSNDTVIRHLLFSENAIIAHIEIETLNLPISPHNLHYITIQ